ncbi:hypothetical protein [Dryocola sp. BD626]
MTKLKHSCYKQGQKSRIIRKSYRVSLSPENKLCNSVMVLTQ